MFQNVQTVHLVKNVGEIAKQIVIAVIKGQGFVKTVVNLDGKATIVEKVMLLLSIGCFYPDKKVSYGKMVLNCNILNATGCSNTLLYM